MLDFLKILTWRATFSALEELERNLKAVSGREVVMYSLGCTSNKEVLLYKSVVASKRKSVEVDD